MNGGSRNTEASRGRRGGSGAGRSGGGSLTRSGFA